MKSGDSPFAQILKPALAALVCHAVPVAAYAGRYGDVAACVCVGDERVGQPPYERIQIGFAKGGYDGQFYYALARAPWAVHERGMDTARVRQLRIFYPLLGWLLTAGDAFWLLWVLPAINLAAIAGIAAVGAALAIRHGWNAWWGFLLPIAVNAGLPALRDLTDVLSTLALCLLLLMWLTRAPLWGVALAGAAALFSREQNLLILLLLIGAAWWQDRRSMAWTLAVVIVAWSGWVAALRLMYGDWPFLRAGSALAAPFAGMAEALGQTQGLATMLNGLAMAYLVLLMGLAHWLIRSRCDRVVVAMALAGAVLAAVGGVAIYASPWSHARVFTWLPLGLWVGSLQTNQRWLAALLTPGGAWPAIAVAQAWLT